ncbi:MAG: uracil-DNA glycosylase [Lentimicrobiaceae bacterium]|nr:uracil-DNA glycosylase [Lentimicrobiaceae bacterium]
MSELLKNIKVDSSWKKFINSDEIKKTLKDIEVKIGSNFTPKENVLRFLETDLKKIKVIILGQDPYPQEGVATGRAFEVGDKCTWLESISQTSLINIIKAIYYMDQGGDIDIDNIRQEIGKKFKINPSIKCWFCNLENQGVLFLNTAFTCKEKPIEEKPKKEKSKEKYSNAHSGIWNPFTEKLIRFIILRKPTCKWLLWGKYAESIIDQYPCIKEGINRYTCCHPSYVPKTKDKINCNFIKDSAKGLIETGIDWLGNKDLASS